ncbi:UNVERIFIED_CONTAM: hypothetical protein GTU68_031402, partial [Idotea baltica]|nr:hypothetical protein [Idotea baltica]
QIEAQKVIEEAGKHLLVDVVPIIVDLDKSKGNRLVDARDGKSWLDCFSYIASNTLGFNHPGMFDAAFEERLLRTARSKPANSDFYTKELAEFVATFSKHALPDSMKYLFFIEGGALAVENAMKVAFDWKVRKNIAAGRSAQLGTKILHFKEAFHGRTGYTLSVTNTADQRKIKYFPKFDWPRVENPKVTHPLEGSSLDDVVTAEQRSIAEIEQAFATHKDDIAAILIEPIQGEGGDNHFRPEFHQKLRELADQHEALLIYDEVQSGFGLTGKMWAFEHYGMTPDIVSFGKKAQVCGIMASARVDEVENHVFSEPSRINSTWGGGLVDMVRVQRYLEIMEEESLVDNAAVVGDYLQGKLSILAENFPSLLSNPRGKGLMCAIDLKTTEQRDEVFKQMFLEGVLVLKAGLTTIRLRPSLTFSKSEVDEFHAVFETVIGRIES